MEIKKGMKFRCIKDAPCAIGVIAYKEGIVYVSDRDGCITDIQGDNGHSWSELANVFFEKIEEEQMKYDLEKTVVCCTTQEEFDKVLEWHYMNLHIAYCGNSANNVSYAFGNFKGDILLELKNDFKYYPSDKKIVNTILSFRQFEHNFLNKQIEAHSESSVKNDFKDGKLRWDLLPLELIEEVVKVYDAGAKKYGANRWQNLDDGYNRYKSALLRHLLASEKEDIDEDTGCYHIAQICWNALSMLHFKLKEKEE